MTHADESPVRAGALVWSFWVIEARLHLLGTFITLRFLQ